METTTLYTQGKCSIDYDPSVPCMIGRHVGFQTNEEFKQFLTKGLELMIEKKEPTGKMAWVPDARESDATDEESLVWAAEVWNKRALEAGIRHVAFVLPEDQYAMSTISAEVYKEQTESKEDNQEIISRMFKDQESAKAWLREVFNGE